MVGFVGDGQGRPTGRPTEGEQVLPGPRGVAARERGPWVLSWVWTPKPAVRPRPSPTANVLRPGNGAAVGAGSSSR